MTERVMVLQATALNTLGAVRCTDGLMAAHHTTQGQIWLRGIPVKNTPTALLQLPALHTYTLNEQGLLFSTGSRVPKATLPNLPWQRLNELLTVEAPVSLHPGQATPQTIHLVPATAPQAGAAITVPLKHLHTYASTAPAIRLQQLRYTLLTSENALLLGTPLPALPGNEYWQQGQLLLPAGFDLHLKVAAPLLQQAYCTDNRQLMVIHANSTWQLIDHQHLVVCTRSSIRQTANLLHHG